MAFSLPGQVSFLNPALLLGLPLMVLPVAIHFWNRRRFRKVPWGATMFLREALRESRGRTRLRHFLVLACRVLAVALLFLAMAKPIVGSWAGRLLLGKPRGVTVIVLDRSPSMETEMVGGSGVSRRTAALRRLQSMCRKRGVDEVILVENSGLPGAPLTTAVDWATRPECRPIDAGSDLAAMLERALDEVDGAGQGDHEIWLATDIQATAWQSDSPRWEALRARVRSMVSPPVLHRLIMGGIPTDNLSVRMDEARLIARPGGAALELRGHVSGSPARAGDVTTLSVMLGGGEVDYPLRLGTGSTAFEIVVENVDPERSDWGALRLPADENPADNPAFFAFEPLESRRVLVIAEDRSLQKLLAIAAAPRMEGPVTSEVVDPSALDEETSDSAVAVVWQGAAPVGRSARALQRFVERGGQVMSLPGDTGAGRAFSGLRWTGLESRSTASNFFEVAPWQRDEGLLADAEGRQALPVDRLAVRQRALVEGPADSVVWARFLDGNFFLISRRVGNGMVWACATLPDPEWSALGEGLVLVPMLQRLVDSGMDALSHIRYIDCGTTLPEGIRLNDVDEVRRQDGLRAGVFREGDDFEVFRRPVREDDASGLSEETMAALFTGWRQAGDEVVSAEDSNASFAWWTPLLVTILVALFLESWLSMPQARRGKAPA